MAGNDIGGFTSGDLQLASWWVRNRLALRRWGFLTLIVLSVFVWGYALWGLADAYLISYPRESRFTRDVALNNDRLAGLVSQMPKNVDVGPVFVSQTTDNRIDMVVELTNTNEQWWAEFNYHFSLSGEQTSSRSGYVLPVGKQLISELGYAPRSKGGRTATLVVENVRWHRIDPNFIGADYRDFAGKRLAMTFENIAYDPNITLGTKRVAQTSFTLVNRGAYGFWSVELYVRLYRGSSPVAVTKYTAEKVSPGERRDITVTWPDNLPSVTKTEIIPQIKLTDPGAFLPTQYFDQ